MFVILDKMKTQILHGLRVAQASATERWLLKAEKRPEISYLDQLQGTQKADNWV